MPSAAAAEGGAPPPPALSHTRGASEGGVPETAAQRPEPAPDADPKAEPIPTVAADGQGEAEGGGGMSERQVGRVLLAVNMLSFVAFIGGLVVILLGFPHMAKNTYFSENALLPGSGNLAFSDAHARAALALAASLTSSSPPSSSSSSAQSPAVRILLDAARSAGLDASTHAFTPPGSDQEHTSVVAVLHAARGDGKEVVVLASEYPAGVQTESELCDGKEVVVLASEYPSGSQVPGAAESAGLLLALMQLFARAPWLSKDIIFILTPSDAPRHTP
ncbi:hypothetical protein T484DRAFT_1851326 [Baffinella frigidus]|nr:hypothetical protein T484DRAFT_1851326 [Cryptophyta sp. CCMP2293]